MKNRTTYPSRMAHIKFDATHILVFLNEEKAKHKPVSPGTEGETPEIDGYAYAQPYWYAGPETDGAVMIEAQEFTKDGIVPGLIHAHPEYAGDGENKIHSLALKLQITTDQTEREAITQQLQAFDAHRTWAYETAEELLARTV